MMTLEEGQQLLVRTMVEIQTNLSEEDWRSGKLFTEVNDIVLNYQLQSSLYLPRAQLKKRLQEFYEWENGLRDEDKGRLMEEIAALAFGSLTGWDSIASYQSYAPQHDLVISGSSDPWFLLMACLHLPKEGRTIVVEAKNLDTTLTDAHVSRLGWVVQNKFESTCHLGVFVSMNDISGIDATRQLRDARATQILFHATTKKFIVVITKKEFEYLLQPGGLITLLQQKIEDVEKVSRVPLSEENWVRIDCPPHIARYFSDSLRDGEIKNS